MLDWRFESKFHLVAHDMHDCVALSFSLIYPYHISKLTELSKYTHICARVYICVLGFPGSLVSKESTCSAGDRSLIPGSGRSPGEGIFIDFPGDCDSDGTESACNAASLDSIPGLGKFPGGGHGNPLQYSCVENPIDRGAWWATVRGVTKSQTQLSN